MKMISFDIMIFIRVRLTQLSKVNSLFRKISKVLILKIISIIAVFVMHANVARNLGVDQYGHFSFTLVIVIIGTLVSQFGIPMYTVRSVAILNERRETEELHRKLIFNFLLICVLSCAFSSLIAVVVNLTSFHLIRDATIYFINVGLLCVIPFSVITYISEAARGLGYNGFTICFRFCLIPLTFLAGLQFNNLSNGIDAIHLYIGSCVTVAIIATIVACYWLSIKSLKQLHLQPIAPLIKSALPFYAHGIVNQGILVWGASMIISVVSSYDSLAHFSVCSRLASVYPLLLFPLNQVLSKYIVKHHINDTLESFSLDIQKMVAGIATLGFLITMGYIAFGKLVLSLFGEQYQVSYTLLLIISFGNFLSIISGPVLNVLTMTEYVRDAAIASGITAIIILTLGTILLTGFGLIGMAIALLISKLSLSIIASVFLYKRLKIVLVPTRYMKF